MSKKKDKKRKDKKRKDEEQAAEGVAEQVVPVADTPLEPMSKGAYRDELRTLHEELVCLQEWVKSEGLKVCIVFEGRDGAGKGGVIKALTDRVSPRVFRVVALQAPTDRERTQMYVQRYVSHLPAAGEVVIFDRSWYNRAGVERVMGFASEKQVERFLAIVPDFERAMVDSGIILLKYWLEVSPEEQEKRLADRIDDRRKTWKLSPMDVESFEKWDEYTEARDAMFAATHTAWAPWHLVVSDDKERARLNLISHFLSKVPYEAHKPDKVKLPRRKAEASPVVAGHVALVPTRF